MSSARDRVPAHVRWVVRVIVPLPYSTDLLEDLADVLDGRRNAGWLRDAGRCWREILSPHTFRLALLARRRERIARRRQRWRRGPGGLTVLGDFRYAVRGLARNRLFSLAAVASLALGVGANTAIFSVVNAVLLRPLPYAHPERLAIVWNAFPTAGLVRLPVSGVELQALQRAPDLFEDAGGIWATSRTVLSGEGPVQVSAGLITPNFFSVIGIEPALGRSFADDESGAPVPPGVILSDEFWRTRLAADPDVLQRSIALDAGAAPVIGVMPPGFKLLFPSDGGIPQRLDVFVPLPWDLGLLPPDQHFLRVVGRLQPGVERVAAQAQVAAVAREMRETYAALAATGDEFTIVPLHGDSVRSARPVLLALLGGVGLFLLLASANVASLVLARTTTRGREMAIRASLGASRRRIMQLLLVESLTIAAAGGLAGSWLGWQTAKLLWTLRPEGIARVDSVTLDGTVFGFALAVSTLAAIVFGVAPLTQIKGQEPATTLKRGSAFATGSGRRARRAVTVTEVAVGLVLVIGAVLMSKTLAQLQRADVGFDTRRLLTFKVALSNRRFPSDGERARLAASVEDRVRDLPGVLAVGATSHLPFADWANWGGSAAPEGTPEADRDAFFIDHRSVTPGYLDAIGAHVRAGRGFAEQDRGEADAVVIIDRTYARRAFPDGDAVGRQLYPTRYRDGAFTNTPAVVIGVIDDVRDRSPGEASSGQVYWPFAQSARWELTYVARTEGDPLLVIDDVRRVVTGVHQDLAAAEIRTMDEYVSDATAHTRFVVLLAGVFSVLAIGLAGLGLYSVVTYTATQRSHELGMRIALGAGERDILKSVLRDGLRLGAWGVMVGLLAAAGLTRFLGVLLYEVSPLDPAAFGGVALLFLAITVAASLGPAYRATRVDPLESMRPD